jgi:PAS domain S-box-containing protein
MPKEIEKLQELTQELLKKDKLLQQSKEHYHFLIESLPDVVYTTNSEGNIDFISDKITAFKYTTSDIIGQPFLNIIYKEDREKIQKIIGEVIKEKQQKIKIEFRLKTVDGSFVWISNHISLVYDEKGVVIKSIGVCRDITERRQFEQLVYDRCALLQVVSDNIEGFVWFKDINNKYLFASKRFYELLIDFDIVSINGYTDKELKEKFPSYSQGHLIEFSDEITKKELKPCRFYEIFKEKHNQEEIWLDVKKSPLIVNHQLMGTIGVAFNITKEAEDIKKGLQTRIDKKLIKVIVPNYIYQLERV